MNTKHKADCRMAFGRKDATCPRCQELIAGAAPRAGWQQAYYSRKRYDYQAYTEAIHDHFSNNPNHGKPGNRCYPVCTAFDS